MSKLYVKHQNSFKFWYKFIYLCNN